MEIICINLVAFIGRRLSRRKGANIIYFTIYLYHHANLTFVLHQIFPSPSHHRDSESGVYEQLSIVCFREFFIHIYGYR